MSVYLKMMNESTNLEWHWDDDKPLDHGNKHGDVLIRLTATTPGKLRFVVEKYVYVHAFTDRHSHLHKWRVYDRNGTRLEGDSIDDYEDFEQVGNAITDWLSARRDPLPDGGTFVKIEVDHDYDSIDNYTTFGCSVLSEESESDAPLTTTVGHDSIADALIDICEQCNENGWIITEVEVL